MELYTREYGEGEPLVILHGLFGSSANWNGIARRLADDYRVIVPDLRNHGRSPHHPGMSYPEMAGDVLALLDTRQLDRAVILGHSMGGKLAMWLALRHPERVSRLIVADIAPVTYSHDFHTLIRAMRAMDPETLSSRDEADARLARGIPDPGIRQFVLQNLAYERGVYRWRINLSAMEAGMDDITGFPEPSPGTPYVDPALFVHGERSDYVDSESKTAIRALFPAAKVVKIANTGHWLHVEQPEAFVRELRSYLTG